MESEIIRLEGTAGVLQFNLSLNAGPNSKLGEVASGRIPYICSPVIASWFIKLWIKLWIATQKGSITDICLKGATSAAHTLLEGSLRADSIFLSGLDTNHIWPVHRAENGFPPGTHPYQLK